MRYPIFWLGLSILLVAVGFATAAIAALPQLPETDPVFWLGLSLLLVSVSMTAVLVVAVPAFQELTRAARSAQKLFDTLSRDLPPTLESIRLTGLELSDLTDDLSEGVKTAGQVVKHVDRSIDGARQQAQRVHGGTRRVLVGVRAAWKSLTRSNSNRLSTSTSRRLAKERRSGERLRGNRSNRARSPEVEPRDLRPASTTDRINPSELSDNPAPMPPSETVEFDRDDRLRDPQLPASYAPVEEANPGAEEAVEASGEENDGDSPQPHPAREYPEAQ